MAPACNPGDDPERPPLLQPVWHLGNRMASFNYVPGWNRTVVVIPFPWRLVTDPVIGAAYLPLWAGEMPYCAGAVLQAAQDGYGGFRFAAFDESMSG